MASQLLASTVIKLIRAPWIEKVRFSLQGLSIFEWRYEVVATAIAQGKITCEVGVPPDTKLPPGYAPVGQYDPKKRQFRFPIERYGSSSGQEKLSMVHEATHAAFDCHYGRSSGTDILAIDDEAAAWLAQAVYLLESPVIFWDGPMIPGDPMQEAAELAKRMMAVPNHLDVGRPPYIVPSADSFALRQSVARVYNFQGNTAGTQHTYHGLP